MIGSWLTHGNVPTVGQQYRIKETTEHQKSKIYIGVSNEGTSPYVWNITEYVNYLYV